MDGSALVAVMAYALVTVAIIAVVLTGVAVGIALWYELPGCMARAAARWRRKHER